MPTTTSGAIAAVESAAIDHQLIPLGARLARHHDRQGLGVRAGEQGGEEILVPAQDEREDEGRHHAGQGERQHDAQERAQTDRPSTSAASSSSIGIALN